MFNVCPRCGTYCDTKTIDPTGPFAVCPHCGHPHPFLQLPLFVLTGASGAGKTTIALHLPTTLLECVTMESDILWGVVPATADDDYQGYHNTWLRVAKNIGQSGRPVVLVGSALPQQFEKCPERRYFTNIHYLAVVCDDDTLAQRLRSRPAWRRAGTAEFINDMVTFNAYLKDHGGSFTPPMTILDTGRQSIEESTAAVIAWVRERLPASPGHQSAPHPTERRRPPVSAAAKSATLEAIVGTLALPADVTIRAWDAADFPIIQQLSTAEGWTTPLERADDALEAWRRSWPTLVAIQGEAVIGFCRSLSDGLVTTYVAELLVVPARRRLGIASALLEATQRLCPGSRLDLLSTVAADPFYQQAGFRQFAGFRLSWAERMDRSR